MRLVPLLALGLLIPGAASARPLVKFRTEADELKDGQERLKDLEEQMRTGAVHPIQFEFDKAILLPSSRTALEVLSDLLLTHPHLKLLIFGHTCDIGGYDYNIWLSKKRANAVKSYLIRLGVMGESMRAKGFGFTKPLYPNDSEENRSKNRRVELFLTTRWWESVY